MGKKTRKRSQKNAQKTQKPKPQIQVAEKVPPESRKGHKLDRENESLKKIKHFCTHKLFLGIIIPIIVGVLIEVISFTIENKKEENKPSSFSAIMNLHPYSIGIVEEENIPIYHSNEKYCTRMEISATNQNNVTVNIKNIIVEVMDYKGLNEIKIKGPTGGANEKEIFFWDCEITPEKDEYYSKYIGTDESSLEDISRTKYVEMQPDDSGEFVVKIRPDKPGLYEVKATIEYAYKNTIERKETKCGKFIFDPKHEGNYEPL